MNYLECVEQLTSALKRVYRALCVKLLVAEQQLRVMLVLPPVACGDLRFI
jgi:hypothetical protein